MRYGLTSRPALTVVEVLVALMLVSVGLLGMAGTSALTLRAASAALHERRATQRATTRLALLSAAGCERATSGTLDEPATGLRERWTVAPARAGFALVEASVDWRSHGPRLRTLTLRSAIMC